MPAPNVSNGRLKAACSVTEMARLVGLSRARFYDLVAEGIFLPPVYSLKTRRPLYTRAMQEANVQARQDQQGVNGDYILFYAPRQEAQRRSHGQRDGARASRVGSQVTNLHRQLQGLGLDVSVDQVDRVMRDLFPDGVNGAAAPEVLRTLYRHLRRSIAAR